jgi:hypothetical protein
MVAVKPLRVTELRSALHFVPGHGTMGTRLLLDAEVVEVERIEGALAVRSEVCAQASEIPSGIPSTLPDPGDLPDLDVATQWGNFVTAFLCDGIGEECVEGLLTRSLGPDEVVRLVFRALDPETARIPFETLRWPTRGAQRAVLEDEGRNLSIVRTADILRPGLPAPLGGWDPGWYRVRIVAAPGSRGDPGLTGAAGLKPGEKRRGLNTVETSVKTGFTGAEDELRSVVGEPAPDLVVLAGHGSRGKGMDASAETVPRWISGPEIAQAVGCPPSAVVLAMCGSAAAGIDLSPSAAAEIARVGATLVLGFQAAEPAAPHVDQFVDAFVRHVRETILEHGPLVSLVDWERSMIAARADAPAAAVTTVLYVHPSLCAGRARVLQGAPARRGRPLTRTDRQTRAATAIPFYVPGQVVCFEHDGRTLRVPLPVDIGAVVKVDLGRGASGGVRGTGAVEPSLTVRDLERLARAWDLPTGDVGVRVESAFGAREWAGGAAELSAVVRALAALLGTRPPDRVLELLDEHVRDEWGAHDGAPRVVDLEGRRVARFPSWPPLVVKPPSRPLRIPAVVVDIMRDQPATIDSVPGNIEALGRALSGHGGAMKVLLGRQKSAFRAHPGLPRHVADLLAQQGAVEPVVVPGFALIEGWTSVASESADEQRPRYVGVAPRSVDAGDVLG